MKQTKQDLLPFLLLLQVTLLPHRSFSFSFFSQLPKKITSIKPTSLSGDTIVRIFQLPYPASRLPFQQNDPNLLFLALLRWIVVRRRSCITSRFRYWNRGTNYRTEATAASYWYVHKSSRLLPVLGVCSKCKLVCWIRWTADQRKRLLLALNFHDSSPKLWWIVHWLVGKLNVNASHNS